MVLGGKTTHWTKALGSPSQIYKIVWIQFVTIGKKSAESVNKHNKRESEIT